AHKNYVITSGFSPDNRQLVSAGFDGTVKVWDPVTGQVAHDFPAGLGTLHHVRFSRNGTRLMAVNSKGAVKLWKDSGKQLQSHAGHTLPNTTVVALCPNGSWVAWGLRDTISLKHLAGQRVLTLSGHTAQVWHLAVNPDGSRLASASSDRTVKVWETATGRE